LRRDAELNRQRILSAAAQVFTDRGLEATLDDVARQAGVGVGTVYRRFADKSALADALFEQRIDALAAMAERAEADADPWRALVSFLHQAAETLAADRGLRQILMFAAAGHERCNYARERMRPARSAATWPPRTSRSSNSSSALRPSTASRCVLRSGAVT